MSLVQQMIGDLAQEGFIDSQGSFSIDVSGAQQKLAQFSLADPYQWVLKMMQAATLLGSKQVAVSSRGAELGFRFEGLKVSSEEFAHCLAALTLSKPTSLRERGLHHLAQALQILKRRGLLLRAAQPGQCFAAQGEHILTRPTDRHWQGNPMLTLVVVRGWSWLQREWPEVEWLRRRAYCSPTRLEFDLQPFPRKLQPPRPGLFSSVPQYSKVLLLAPSSPSQNYTRQKPVFESPGRTVQLYSADSLGENRQILQRWDFGGEVEGMLATYQSKGPAGRLQVWLDGVLSEPVAIPGSSCDAVLSGAGFSCDLSGLRLVEDDYLRSRLEQVTYLSQQLVGPW